jgi:hypothetical protein
MPRLPPVTKAILLSNRMVRLSKDDGPSAAGA